MKIVIFGAIDRWILDLPSGVSGVPQRLGNR
jgi:hypothetical protein